SDCFRSPMRVRHLFMKPCGTASLLEVNAFVRFCAWRLDEPSQERFRRALKTWEQPSKCSIPTHSSMMTCLLSITTICGAAAQPATKFSGKRSQFLPAMHCKPGHTKRYPG